MNFLVTNMHNLYIKIIIISCLLITNDLYTGYLRKKVFSVITKEDYKNIHIHKDGLWEIHIKKKYEIKSLKQTSIIGNIKHTGRYSAQLVTLKQNNKKNRENHNGINFFWRMNSLFVNISIYFG